ncbi:unnamed protein product, partial [marine sediment metagenome]
KSAAEGAAIGIGEKLQPALEAVTKVLIRALAVFNKSDGVLQTVTATVLSLTVAVSGLAVGLGLVAKVMTAAVIPAFVKGIVLLKAFFLAMGPIGWATLALTALAGVLIAVAKRHHELNEAVQATAKSIGASRKAWQEYYKVLKQSEIGVKLAEMAFKAQAQMAEGNRLLAISAHGSAREVREALEVVGKDTSFWTGKNRKALARYAKDEINFGQKRVEVATGAAAKEIGLIEETARARKGAVQRRKILTNEEKKLMD